MRYSLLIPTYARHEMLFRCLGCVESYLKSDPSRGFEVEVIVSDDEQSDGLRERLAERYPLLRYVEGPGRGPAANRNCAASQANGDWLVFLDDDCEPYVGWIEAFDAVQADADVLEGKTTADRKMHRFDEEAPINIRGDALWSCNMAIRRKLFAEMNGFDEEFIHATMEDVDLHLRLKKSGARILFVEDANVLHRWRRIRGLGMLKRRLKSRTILWQKHPELRPKSPLINDLRGVVASARRAWTPTRIIQFRGRGLLNSIGRHAYKVYWAFLSVMIRH